MPSDRTSSAGGGPEEAGRTCRRNRAKVVWAAVVGHLFGPNPERGVYKTTDGGKNWKQTLFVDANTGAVDIDIDTNNYVCQYTE